MERRFAVSEAQIIYGLALPLAVLMGFMLAMSTNAGNMGLILAILGVLAIPIFIRCCYLALILGGCLSGLWTAQEKR
jgi:hypothetical protein